MRDNGKTQNCMFYFVAARLFNEINSVYCWYKNAPGVKHGNNIWLLYLIRTPTNKQQK